MIYNDVIPGLGDDVISPYGLNKDGTSPWSEHARKAVLDKARKLKNGKT